ncbi:MAG TPA: hypothetical protein VIY08_12370 [Candidatus Nitrosocosmicus sp.]
MVTANGEIIAGASLLIMGLIFIGAGMVNTTWGAIIIPDLVIVAIGASTLGLGIWTIKYNEKHHVSSHHH